MSRHNTDIVNVTMTTLLRHSGLTTAGDSEAKHEHGCLVLQPKSDNVQQSSGFIVSDQTKYWLAVISSAVFVPILFAVGVPCNILSAAVFYRLGLRERINFCVFCLAIVDIVVITVTFCLAMENLHHIFIGPFSFFNRYMLGLTGFIRVSMFLSVVIAAERCFCVVSPLRAQRMLSTRTLAVFVGVISLLLVVGMQVVAGHRRTEICVFDPTTNSFSSVLTFSDFYLENKEVLNFFSQIVYGTAMLFIFFILILVATIITAVRLRSASRWRQVSSSASSQSSGSSSDYHMVALTRTLVATSVLFVVCLSPILLVELTSFFVPGVAAGGQYKNLRQSMWKVINVFRCVNSSLNFFFYYHMGSRFRRTLKEFLFCLPRSDSVEASAKSEKSSQCVSSNLPKSQHVA